MLPIEGHRIGDPVGLGVRTGGYGRREGGWVVREPGRREDRATHGTGNLRMLKYYFSGIGGSWAHVPS